MGAFGRRACLRRVGSAIGLGLTAGLGGCSQAGELFPAGPVLAVADTESEVVGFGNVLLFFTVENTGDRSGVAKAACLLDVDDGQTYTRNRELTKPVPPGERVEYRTTFDVYYGDSLQPSDYDASVTLGEPTVAETRWF